MRQIVCDRCHKEIKNAPWHRVYVDHKNNPLVSDHLNEQDYDLCDFCFKVIGIQFTDFKQDALGMDDDDEHADYTQNQVKPEPPASTKP
jgi:hypothetical protein